MLAEVSTASPTVMGNSPGVVEAGESLLAAVLAHLGSRRG